MKAKLRLTTVALDFNQHLLPIYHASIVETYCEGYTDNKRDKKLDGYYFTIELTVKPPRIENLPTDYNLFIK
jgi:hypothetical protein